MMKHRIGVLQPILLLLVVGFAPGDALLSIEEYTQNVTAEIEKFKHVLIGQKCSSPEIAEDTYGWCTTMKEEYCHYRHRSHSHDIFDMCMKSCCQHTSMATDESSGCINRCSGYTIMGACTSPCDGYLTCIDKHADPDQSRLAHCEENSFNAVNLSPVITAAEIAELENLDN